MDFCRLMWIIKNRLNLLIYSIVDCVDDVDCVLYGILFTRKKNKGGVSPVDSHPLII